MTYRMAKDIRDREKVAKYLWYNSEINRYWSGKARKWVDRKDATLYTNDERLEDPNADGWEYWTKA